MGGTQSAIPYEKLANTEILCRKWTKYRYRIHDRWRLLNVVSISRVFFISYRHIYTRNQPQPSRKTWEDLELIGANIEKPGHCMSYQFYHRVTVRNCVFIYRLSLKSSKYWPALDRRGQINSAAIPWKIFVYRIPLAIRMKNRIPQDWMIPQYRTLKSKLPKYRLKKKKLNTAIP